VGALFTKFSGVIRVNLVTFMKLRRGYNNPPSVSSWDATRKIDQHSNQKGNSRLYGYLRLEPLLKNLGRPCMRVLAGKMDRSQNWRGCSTRNSHAWGLFFDVRFSSSPLTLGWLVDFDWKDDI
jgi:hypothetical protein